ncbi:MAG: PD-(D/E)XK nuclease family protein, partial [Gemmatimonadaceae bacterium]|nr:PD-(D/E)XK nuclease family protein [Gemmatimonadaceae bacterium]
ELQALRDLLHALAMPTDEVAVVAALEGLCFGCTPAQLHAARTLGASFMLERPPHVTRDEADNETRAMAAPVIDALHTLHAWWRLAGQMPPAALVDRLLDETGLLPLAASQVLGDRRAGALLGLAESLRRVAMQGDDLVDLLEAFDALLGGADGARALQAGEGGAVRIMNLHKAKGLEAPIVVLAAPRVGDAMPRDLVVTRDRQTGEARGAIRLLRGRGPQAKAVAEPADWQEWGARDAILEGEETARLLYVAATRAGHSLHVATTTKGNSPWQPLDATLAARGVEVTSLAVHPAPGRRRADIDLATLHAEIAAADARRTQAARGTLVVQAVTEEVKREHRQEEAAPIDEGALALDAADGAARDGDGLVPRPALTLGLDALTAALSDGRQWGTAVHQAIEAAVRTRAPERLTEQLDAIAWHEWPGLTDETRSALTAELQQTIDRAQQSPAWARLMRDGTVHAELAVAHVDTSDGVTVVREGVIDAIRLSDDGCFVADWKSDRVADDGWHARRAVYEAQVAMYARAVQAVTGRPVEAQVVRVSG